MERPGEKLRQARERLKLTYRDVVEASQLIADRRGSEEFSIALSRLADIENKGTLPTIYRIYTLSAVYRLDWREVLQWYGIPLEMIASDGFAVHLDETHAVDFSKEALSHAPEGADREIDPQKTTLLSYLARRWGKMPFSFLNGLGQRHLQYGLIGAGDWSMYPLLRPGSLVLVDQSRRKIAPEGWSSEVDRPIYFLEHREGFHVGWCAAVGDRLLLERHPSAQLPPRLFDQSDIDVVGQVTGVAMLLETKKRRHVRTSTIPVKSPGQ